MGWTRPTALVGRATKQGFGFDNSVLIFFDAGWKSMPNIWRYDSGKAKGGGEIENIETSQKGLLGARLLKRQHWMAAVTGQMWLAPPPRAPALRSWGGGRLKEAPRAVSERRHSVGVLFEERRVAENIFYYSEYRYSKKDHSVYLFVCSFFFFFLKNWKRERENLVDVDR